ncbi:histidine kinase [Gemmobacter tilapiae]|uniref:histidine kinase n=2 Tax=Neogemmobacter tilapiae TaxID=875041 RepID=A0A918WMU9_9RHOB|nr:histidine kinase [Gemmobacter tilapiae]
MLAATVAVGYWVSNRIEEAVVRNTANATALYMESFLSPITQDIDRGDALPPGAILALEEVLEGTSLGERVKSFKIWKPDGRIIYASDPTLIGKVFPVDDGLKAAFEGVVSGEIGGLDEPENTTEAALGIPLLEIYSPVREVWSGRIVGVAEFYEVADGLTDDLAKARWRSWGAVALVMLGIGGAMFLIVLQGSRTIDSQRAALTGQMAALRDLADQNLALRLRVQEAAGRASAMNDRALRRAGADLHDGPAQLLGFAALRLDSLRGLVGEPEQTDLDQVESALRDSLQEIRQIARGLSLPEIEARPIDQIVQGVVQAHEARHGVTVAVTGLSGDIAELGPAARICLYRFVQEGLNNGWKHAGGAGQRVSLHREGRHLQVTVSDEGPGLSAEGLGQSEGMGLAGLRDRVESLGGSLILTRRGATGERPGGMDLIMMLEIQGGGL